MSTILFVCTGNTCRSVMAEAILRRMLEKEGPTGIDILSRGTSALQDQPASEGTLAALQEIGLSAERHRSQPISYSDIQDSRLILTMTEAHRGAIVDSFPEASEKTFVLKQYAGDENEPIDIADPIGGSPDDYRRSRDEIQDALLAVFNKIKEGSLT